MYFKNPCYIFFVSKSNYFKYSQAGEICGNAESSSMNQTEKAFPAAGFNQLSSPELPFSSVQSYLIGNFAHAVNGVFNEFTYFNSEHFGSFLDD